MRDASCLSHWLAPPPRRKSSTDVPATDGGVGDPCGGIVEKRSAGGGERRAGRHRSPPRSGTRTRHCRGALASPTASEPDPYARERTRCQSRRRRRRPVNRQRHFPSVRKPDNTCVLAPAPPLTVTVVRRARVADDRDFDNDPLEFRSHFVDTRNVSRFSVDRVSVACSEVHRALAARTRSVRAGFPVRSPAPLSAGG